MKKNTLLLAACFCMLTANAELKYTNAKELPLYGKISEATETRYERLPAALKNEARKPVWELGKNSSGLFIRFSTNSKAIGVKWDLLNNFNMNHMTPVGIKGLDLYAYTNKGWRFVNSARPSKSNNSASLIENMKGTETEYMLYLPLYDGVTNIEIGVDSTSYVQQPKKHLPQGLPIVWYGTSITQGGCANRPGMSYTNIISRNINREIINLGFSGNGKLDYEIARIMSQKHAALYVIDCLPNVTPEELKEKLIPFLDTLTLIYPKTPILFVENPIYTLTEFDQEKATVIAKKNQILKELYTNYKKQHKINNYYYMPAEDLIGNDGEATVDGVHLTDIGFERYARSITPTIKKTLK